MKSRANYWNRKNGADGLSAMKNNKWFVLLGVTLILFIMPQIGSYVADQNTAFFDRLDPDQNYMWGIIHHLAQALPVLIIMIFWPGVSMKQWGFQKGNADKGLKWVKYFTLIWAGLYVIITILMFLLDKSPDAYYDVSKPSNLAGELFFRFFVVGPSEEILFRSFPIVLLTMVGFDKKGDIFGFEINRAGIIAAVVFALAHIGYSLNPPEITQFDFLQVFTALGMGLLYAIVFRITKSIYYPMIIHAVSDVIPVLGLLALSLLK